MDKQNKILITGASGLSGFYLRNLLQENNYKNIICSDLKAEKNKIDITDYNELNNFIKDTRPDYVFHLAGLLPGCKKEAYDLVNVQGTVNLLEALTANSLFNTKVLVTSSSGVYGNEGDKIITETFALQPQGDYGRSKLEQETRAKEYFSKLPIIITRSVNNFAPGKNVYGKLPTMIKTIADLEKENKSYYIREALDAYRDYLDTRDVAGAYLALMLHGKSGEIYNVSSGQAVQNKELIDFIIQYSKIPIEYKPEKAEQDDYMRYQVLANKKIINQTNWQQKYKVKETLLEMLNYWRKN